VRDSNFPSAKRAQSILELGDLQVAGDVMSENFPFIDQNLKYARRV
jgi:hypothetical protein